MIVTALVLAEYIPHHEPLGFINSELPAVPPGVDKFIRWDAHWYTFIAEHGYDKQTIVFFPVLPALIRLTTYLGFSTGAAGFVICNLCTFMSFLVMYHLFRLDYPERITRQALCAYAVVPTSFFLNSIYTEAPFMVFSLASVYFARTGRWWYAGIFAASAALTRSLGICLFFLLLYEYWSGDNRKSKGLGAVVALLLAPLALLAFMIFNYLLTGDLIAFVHSQQLWGRQFGLPWENIAGNIRLIFTPGWPVVPGTILDSIIVLTSLAGLMTLTLSARYRVRRAYLILGWLWFLAPLFSMTPQFPLYSLSRFALIIFPLYLFIAQLPRVGYWCYILISSALMVLCTALFVNWFWLG